MDELRTNHLFDLANLCSCPPHQVDALRYVDFLQLILDIDAYRSAMKKAAEEG